MPFRESVEDGMGFAGLVPSASEKREEQEWERVKRLSDKAHQDAHELGCIRATLMVNFGKDARAPVQDIVIKEQPSTLNMLVDVLGQLSKMIDQLKTNGGEPCQSDL